MILTVIFWIVVAIDVAALLLIFFLGLAAASSSHTSVFSVAAYLLILPGLVLLAAIALFLFSKTPMGRIIALLVAASPVLVVFAIDAIEDAKLNRTLDASGKMTHYAVGPLRDLSNAIANNNAATVATLAKQVDLNARGYGDATPLILALRQLRQTPEQLEVLRTLVKAGADPNLAAGELPLELALQSCEKSGPEPVRLLLDAGAKPNTVNQFGTPVYYGATGKTISPEVLALVLDHGADLKLASKQSGNVVQYATTTGNWPAVLTLLQRGADWKQIRMLDGSNFPDKLASHRRTYGDEPGLAEVIAFVQARSR